VSPALIDAMKKARTGYIATIHLDETNYLYAENPALLEEPFLRHALQAPLLAQFSNAEWRTRQLANREDIAKARANVAMNLRNLKTLHEAGIHLGFGTDSGAFPQRVIGFAEHRELELMTQAGFTPQQALTVATRDAAALMNLPDRGTLTVGKRADFVVLSADPLKDIRNTREIQAVWQFGQSVAGPIANYSPD
jgi:imidazolonepropionase-like amidohydrolase